MFTLVKNGIYNTLFFLVMIIKGTKKRDVKEKIATKKKEYIVIIFLIINYIPLCLEDCFFLKFYEVHLRLRPILFFRSLYPLTLMYGFSIQEAPIMT